MALSATAIAAFAALTIALALLWAAGHPTQWVRHSWIVAAVAAVALALAGGILEPIGVLALVVFAGLSATPRYIRTTWLGLLAHFGVLASSAALFVHVVPGFDNPRLVDAVTLGTDAASYTKHLNFDKGAAALFLLGLYVPHVTNGDRGPRPVAFAARFIALVVVVMLLTLASGYVRWDPKLPSWWAAWLWSTAFLTAIPEEALFRGCVQSWIACQLGAGRNAMLTSVAVAGLLFGVAHAAGGPAYVVLASVAGMGYGWIYAETRSFSAAVLAHTGLNTVHFLFFTYPSLRVVEQLR